MFVSLPRPDEFSEMFATNHTGDDDSEGCFNPMYPWANTYFGYCIHKEEQLASLILGLLSIVCWLIAQFPQLVKNYRAGNANSLSAIFLAEWLTGDLTSLAGVLLALKQHAVTQLYTAVYFVVMDSSLLIQFIYYKYKHRHARNASLAAFLIVPMAPLLLFMWSQSASPEPVLSHGRTLLTLTTFESTQSIIAYALGWISGVLYFTSRIPQIIKNFRRKSTMGLSLIMFTMAVLGNATYTVSVLLKSVKLDYVISNLPWLLGSGGTLIFDCFIFCQFMYYGNAPPIEDFELGEEEPLLTSTPKSRKITNSLENDY